MNYIKRRTNFYSDEGISFLQMLASAVCIFLFTTDKFVRSEVDIAYANSGIKRNSKKW